MAEAARLEVTLSADTRDFTQALDKAAHDLKSSFVPSLVSAELIADGIQQIGSALWDFAKESFNALGEVERISGQTAAAIASTGGAANVSLEGITGLADSIERLTGIEAETIQTGQNLLLTFTNIKNEAGAGNDIFNQATNIMADMSTAMGGDVKGAALQLGKALNDPITGITALSRVGVTFTDGQKETIKSLTESGKRMEAQKIILAELSREFGGSAKAFGQTMPGEIAKLNNAIGNVGEAIMTGALPAIRAIVQVGTEAFTALGDAIANKGIVEGIISLFGPEVKAMVLGIATAVTAAVIPALGAMAAKAVAAATPMIASAAATIVAWTPFIALAGAIAFAATPIIKYWDDVSFELGRVFDFVKGKAGEFVNWVVKGFQHLANGVVGPVVKFISDKLSALWAMVPEQAKQALKGAGVEFKGLGANLGGALQVAGVAVGEGAKFIAGNMSQSFSGWGDMFKGAQTLVGKFTSAVPVDFGKMLAGVTPALDGVGKATGSASKGVKQHTQAMSKAAAEAAKELEVSLTRGQNALKDFSSKLSVFTNLKAELRGLQTEADLFGDGFVDAGQAADKVKAAMKDLLDKGMSPTAPMMQQLHGLWKNYSAAAKDASQKTFDVGQSFADMEKSLGVVDAKAAVLGETFDAGGARLRIYESQLEDLAVNGFGPASKEVQELKAKIDALKPPKPSGFASFLSDLRDNTTDVLNAVNGLKDGVAVFAETLGFATDGPVFAAVGKFGELAGAAVKIGTSINELIPFFVQMAGFIATSVIPAVSTAIPIIGTALSGAFVAVGAAISAAIWPITLIAAGIAGLIIVGQLIYENWETISAALLPIWQGIADFGMAIWNGLSSTIGGAMGAVWGVISGTWSGIVGFLRPLWEGLSAGARGVAEALVAAFSWASGPLRAIWDGITGIFKGAFNVMIGIVNTLIRGINNIRIQVPDWVPGIGGKGWGGFNLPQIPYLAKGGLVDSPTLAMVGEGKHAEVVLPLNGSVFSQLGAGIASYMPAFAGGGSGGDTYITLQYQGNGSRQDAEAFMEWMVDELRRRGVKIG